MKEYVKPELIEINFASEAIADEVDSDQGTSVWGGDTDVD